MDGSECYSRGRKKEMPCSMCGLLIAPGSVSVPKFTDYSTPTQTYQADGQEVPKEKDYFCADCFRLSRPYDSWCKCSGSESEYKKHEAVKKAHGVRHAEARSPPGPPPGTPPSTALAIPVSAPGTPPVSWSSSSRDISQDRLLHEVECLQKEMREMKETIATLEQLVRSLAVQIASPPHWQGRT